MGDHYALHWEPDMLQDLGSAFRIFATEVVAFSIGGLAVALRDAVQGQECLWFGCKGKNLGATYHIRKLRSVLFMLVKRLYY